MVKMNLRGWRFGVFEADLESHELRKHGIHIKLAGQPFQALSLLLRHPGEVVAREVLRNELWPGEPWGDHDQRLNKAINKVRDALNDSAESPRLIETIPRVGYRFLGSVVPLAEPMAQPVANPMPEPLADLAAKSAGRSLRARLTVEPEPQPSLLARLMAALKSVFG